MCTFSQPAALCSRAQLTPTAVPHILPPHLQTPTLEFVSSTDSVVARDLEGVPVKARVQWVKPSGVRICSAMLQVHGQDCFALPLSEEVHYVSGCTANNPLNFGSPYVGVHTGRVVLTYGGCVCLQLVAHSVVHCFSFSLWPSSPCCCCNHHAPTLATVSCCRRCGSYEL